MATLHEIIVKNTFLTTAKPLLDEPVRRSSSVPRAFKPSNFMVSDSISDALTHASDRDSMSSLLRTDSVSSFAATCSESDFQGIPTLCGWDVGRGDENFSNDCSDCADDESQWASRMESSCASADENPKSRMTLSLDDMVSKESKRVGVKLKSCAKPFKSVRTPPAEVTTVIANAVEVLSKAVGISSVRVRDGGMGGTTMIVGQSSSSNPDAVWVFALVKDALLDSAKHSENTYIVGYDAQPFHNLDPWSFSANVACMPKTHQDTACWDTYEKGVCPRCSTCRWDHPSGVDQMRVIVMIQKAGPALITSK